jgi:hypothetical protein
MPTDFAVQIRYDDQPDLQNLDRPYWNSRAQTPCAHHRSSAAAPQRAINTTPSSAISEVQRQQMAA